MTEQIMLEQRILKQKMIEQLAIGQLIIEQLKVLELSVIGLKNEIIRINGEDDYKTQTKEFALEFAIENIWKK